MSHPVRDSSSLPVGGAPVERGWRDLLSGAFDVFHPQHKKKHRTKGGAGVGATSINSTTPEHEQQRAAQKRPAALLRASSRRLHHAEEADAAAAALSPGDPGSTRRSSWLLDSTRHEDTEWTTEEGDGGDGQQDDAQEDAFPSGSPSSSASAAASPLESVTSPPPPAASPSEVEALQNEMAARAASALQIASVAAAYSRGDCIPVIRDTAAHGRQRSVTMAPGLDSPASGSSQTGLHDGPCVESLLFGETQCADCNADPAAGCAWAQVLAQSNSIPVAQLRSELRALCWETLPAAHRAAVWLVHTVGTDPAVLAHWETYYSGLLASAAATVATSPIAGRRVLGGHPTGSSYSSPHSSPSSPSGRSRAKFTAIAFGELLKDVERTLPNFAFFSDPLGLGVLQRLLTAFSLHRPLIGYCQSLNFFAAMISLTFQSHSEAHAFAVLASMLESRLAYYTKSMLGCVLDARVLRDLVSFFEPELTSVLAKQDVSVEHFSSSWMLCLFIHAPLSLPSALRIWDLYVSLGESVLFHTGLALFHLHARSFTSLHKPSAEQLMNIVLKIIGTTTSIEQLTDRVRETMDTIPSMPDSIDALRKFHKHAIAKEASVLNVSKLRRLERSTGLASAEIQRLWDCFLQGADRWSVLVSGVCNDLVHFRAAFGAAVFPPHASDAEKSHSRRMSAGASHGGVKEHESPKLWKGSGIVQATIAGGHAAPCILCVPPLPRSFHLPSDARPLQTCPRCTWLADGAASQPLIAAAIAQSPPPPVSAAAAAFSSSGSLRRRCTCRCTCVSRMSGLSSSVFGRLFRLFDSRGGVYRGFLDFDSFLFGTSLFTQSNRAQRLRAVFTMAAGEADPAAHTAAGNVLVLDDAEATAEEAHVVRGRVTRAGFVALVQDFETLYHGYAMMPAPEQPPSAGGETAAPPPASLPAAWRSTGGATHPASAASPVPVASPSSSAPPPRPVVLSSLASSQMFVDMAFEKAAADRARASKAKDSAAAPLPPSSSPTAAARLTAAQPAAPAVISADDSLSYESFAACIVLHPLISNFFRLDAIAD